MRTFWLCVLALVATGAMWLVWAALYYWFGVRAMIAARWYSVLVVFVALYVLAQFVRLVWARAMIWCYYKSGRRLITVYAGWIPTAVFGILLMIRLGEAIAYLSARYPDAFGWECWAMGVVYGLFILHEMMSVFTSVGRLRETESEVWRDTHCTRF